MAFLKLTSDALHLCDIGEYEEARNSLPDPDLTSDDAELLCAWGVIASGLGDQDSAKPLLEKSASLGFERAKVHLSVCLWRRKEIPEARALLGSDFLSLLARSAIEIDAEELDAALLTLKEAEPYLDKAEDVFKAKFHNHKGIIYRRQGHIDETVLQFEAASYYSELSGAKDLCAAVKVNLAKLYSDTRDFERAIQYVDSAIGSVKNRELLIESLDQKIRILLDEKSYTTGKRNVIETASFPSSTLMSSIEHMNPQITRPYELVSLLTQDDDREHVNELIELLHEVADPDKARPVMRHLVTLTSDFEVFFENYMRRFEQPAETSELSS